MTHQKQTDDNENDEQSAMSTVSSVASVQNSLDLINRRRHQREQRHPVVADLTAADQPLPSSLSSSSSCVSEEGEVAVDSDTHTVDEDDEWSSGDVPPSSDEDIMIEDDEHFFYTADDTVMHHDLPAVDIVEYYHDASMQPTEEGVAHNMQQQQVTSDGEQQTRNENSTHPLSADDDSANVAASLSPTSGGEADDNGHVMCPICQEHVRFSDINHAPLAVSMLCGHMYHEQCLTNWVDTGKETCPTCRTTCQKRLIQRVYPEWCPPVTITCERKVNVTRSGDNNNHVHLADRRQQDNVSSSSSSSSTELLTSRMLSVLRQTLAERDQLRTLGASLSDIVANRLTGMEQCLDRLFHETQEVGGVVSNQLGRLRRLFDDMRCERDHYRALCGELLALAKQLKSSNRAEPQTSEVLTQRLLWLCRRQSEQIEQLRLFADIEARSDDDNRADRFAPIFARLSAFDVGVAEIVDDNVCGSIQQPQQLVACAQAVAVVDNDQQQRAPLLSDTVLAEPETGRFFGNADKRVDTVVVCRNSSTLRRAYHDHHHATHGDWRVKQRSSFSVVVADAAGIVSSDEDERDSDGRECLASVRCSSKRNTISSIMQRYGFVDDAVEYDSIRKSSLVHANFDESTNSSATAASEDLKMTTRVTVCDNTPYANITLATRAVTSHTLGAKHHVKCDNKLLSPRHRPTMNVDDDRHEQQQMCNNDFIMQEQHNTDEESHHYATTSRPTTTNAIRPKRNGVAVSSRRVATTTSHAGDKHDNSNSTPSADYTTTHSNSSRPASPISSSSSTTSMTHISVLSTDSDDAAAFGSNGDECDSRILYRRQRDDNLSSTTTALRRQQQLPSAGISGSSRCVGGVAVVRHIVGSSRKAELKKNDLIQRDLLYERIVARAQRAHDEIEKAAALSAVDSGRYCSYSDDGDEQ